MFSGVFLKRAVSNAALLYGDVGVQHCVAITRVLSHDASASIGQMEKQTPPRRLGLDNMGISETQPGSVSEDRYRKTRLDLRWLFDDAIAAISAEAAMPQSLPQAQSGRTLIIAAGKAAAAMTAIAAKRIKSDVFGLVVTRYGHGVTNGLIPSSIEVIEAGHPIPDDAGMEAAQKALAFAKSLTPADQLLMLISGGASALLTMPAPGVSFSEKQEINKTLLNSGATISEINCVRKHLSAIKGGRLATAAAPAQIATLAISDIPGDDASFIGSGPTIADPSTLEDARAIIQRYSIEPSQAVVAALENPLNETPSADALGLAGSEVRVIAKARDALAKADALARSWGYSVTDLGDHLQAEARHLGAGHAALARRISASGERHLILSGGETTVTVKNNDGRGGRNLEYLLSLAISLDGAPGVSAIACDTDGIDGTEDNAGAIVTPDTLMRAKALNMSAKEFLGANNSYGFFEKLGDLVVTGPTRTNTNDFRAIMIDPNTP